MIDLIDEEREKYIADKGIRFYKDLEWVTNTMVCQINESLILKLTKEKHTESECSTNNPNCTPQVMARFITNEEEMHGPTIRLSLVRPRESSWTLLCSTKHHLKGEDGGLKALNGF